MTLSPILLAAALQAQPAVESAIGNVAFNWSYGNRAEADTRFADDIGEARAGVYSDDHRLQRLARPRPLSQSDTLDARQLGLSVEFYPAAGTVPVNSGWRFVVGFENERLEISPGASGAALLYRGGSVSVADGYAGMATPVGDRSLVTFGYVRQERTAFVAAREWSDDSHFLGMTYQLSW